MAIKKYYDSDCNLGVRVILPSSYFSAFIILSF